MRLRYTVHSVGPLERAEEVSRADGSKALATVRGHVAELVPDGHPGGTVTLAAWGPFPFGVGDRVEAAFGKVGAPAAESEAPR